MKIVHIAPRVSYNEGWGYQDNLLPKYVAKMGHDVSLIITTMEQVEGKVIEVAESDYMSKDGFRVIRRQMKPSNSCKFGFLFSWIDVYDLLVELKPDLIFYHALVSTTIFQVVRYKKKVNPNVVIVMDNHLDYNIGFDPRLNLKYKIFKYIFRTYYSLTDKYITKVYGVTPWRKKYAEDVFGVPPSKTDVLIMGADDEKIDFKNRYMIRRSIREKYGIFDDDFLIVTGGKIDRKKKIDLLMQAVVGEKKVKLLVFGSVLDDVRSDFERSLSEADNIVYVGWIDASKAYDYFFAADLVLFPGQHSVLWEQACASKVPCVFEYWENMDHVNNGGNSDFISPVTIENIRNKISELKFTEKYFEMKAAAESKKTDVYLYSVIAKKSIECAERGME